MIVMAFSLWSFFYYLSAMKMVNSLSLSSVLLERFRADKTIEFQSKSSSPIENDLNEGSKFHLTCSFLSSFDTIDVFWFHNGSLIESFVSEMVSDEEHKDKFTANSFLGVSIVSTLHIDNVSFDTNGDYQCVAVHRSVYDQQTFRVHVNTNTGIRHHRGDSSRNSLITVYTSQVLFEPRDSVSIMCRFDSNHNNKCQVEWFDQNDRPLSTLNRTTDLMLQNPTFETSMGFYTCQICCLDRCQRLISFVYPTGANK